MLLHLHLHRPYAWASICLAVCPSLSHSPLLHARHEGERDHKAAPLVSREGGREGGKKPMGKLRRAKVKGQSGTTCISSHCLLVCDTGRGQAKTAASAVDATEAKAACSMYLRRGRDASRTTTTAAAANQRYSGTFLSPGHVYYQVDKTWEGGMRVADRHGSGRAWEEGMDKSGAPWDGWRDSFPDERARCAEATLRVRCFPDRRVASPSQRTRSLPSLAPSNSSPALLLAGVVSRNGGSQAEQPASAAPYPNRNVQLSTQHDDVEWRSQRRRAS